MCSHFLVDPVACTPASGWEKGQVENQVGLVRERFFTPRIRVKSHAELNAWLMDQAIAYAKAHRHPEFRDRTIWQVFEAERGSLVPYPGRFDGFHAVPASVSKTCLVRFDNNRYSVAARAVGRPVEIRAYAERIEIRQDGRVVGEHPRWFGRDRTISDPWHYVPILARKPGALRNGAPFKNWVLPAGLERVRRKLVGAADGDLIEKIPGRNVNRKVASPSFGGEGGEPRLDHRPSGAQNCRRRARLEGGGWRKWKAPRRCCGCDRPHCHCRQHRQGSRTRSRASVSPSQALTPCRPL